MHGLFKVPIISASLRKSLDAVQSLSSLTATCFYKKTKKIKKF